MGPTARHRRAATERSSAPMPDGMPLAALTSATVRRLRALVARYPRPRADVFAKVGDSATVNRGFLQCLGGRALASDAPLTVPGVDLDGRSYLRGTIAAFARARAGGRDPFRRDSRAARVGFSARHVLDGRNSPLLQELREISPRFAVVMLGSNDVEGRSPGRFAERMVQLIDSLLSRGVIPIVTTVPDRRDDAAANAFVGEYNLILAAVAKAREVPVIDLHEALSRLPNGGLASDGVHPSVLIDHGHLAPCDFSARGLRFGHNVRNLLTIEMLHALRQTVIEGKPAAARPRRPAVGNGTVDRPVAIARWPFAEMGDAVRGGHADLAEYSGCAAVTSTGSVVRGAAAADPMPIPAEPGPEIVYRFSLDRRQRVHLSAIGLGGADPDLHLLDATGRADRCVARADRELELELSPGTYHLVVDTYAIGRHGRAEFVVSGRRD